MFHSTLLSQRVPMGLGPFCSRQTFLGPSPCIERRGEEQEIKGLFSDYLVLTNISVGPNDAVNILPEDCTQLPRPLA